MKKSLLSGLLIAALLLSSAASNAWAGKGKSYSSGGSSFSGKSFSSGGSSFSGKSYSSGSGGRGSSSGSSFGGSSGGKSYSSGSGFSKPSTSSPLPGGSSSGMGGSKTTPVRPAPAPSPPGSTPSPSGKSYSSGSGSRTAPASPTQPPARYTTPSGKSYAPWSSPASPPPVTRPRGGSFDQLAGAEQRKAESRALYTRGQQPRTTYTDSAGNAHPIDPKDRHIEELRTELDHQRWVNRDLRERNFFGDYYLRPAPVVVYHDPFSSTFWWWLQAQNLQTQAMWAYNYHSLMDAQRYNDLLARDAQLAARVRELEAQGTPPNPTYRPANIDPDLMYTDRYVDAAYNPQPAASPPPTAATPTPTSGIPGTPVPAHGVSSHTHRGLRVLVYALVLIAVLVLLIWLVFFKRWGATGP